MSNKPEDNKIEHKDNSTVDLSRRRLTKAGLIAAPILSTLPGKSALAGNCTSLSGIMSGNLSSQDGQNEPCDDTPESSYGRSPGYWRTVCNNSHSFPLGYDDYHHKLKNFVAGGKSFIFPNATIGDFTALEALWLQLKHTGKHAGLSGMTQPGIDLLRHSIAAVFNGVNDPAYFISPGQVVDVFNDIIASGDASGYYVEPVTGEHVYYSDIINMYEASYVGGASYIDESLGITCEDFRQDSQRPRRHPDYDKGYIYIKDSDGRYVRYFGVTPDYW